MRIIAVRHGETVENARRIMIGHGPGKLSKIGIKQVQALGRMLKKEKPDFIYCSDLKRCKDTLKEIAKYHKHIPVVFTEDLRERNWGILEGKTYKESQLAFEKYKGPRLKYKPKGGESLIDLNKRISGFIKYIKKNHRNEKLLFVTHAGVLRTLNSILTKTSLVKSYGKFRFHNSSVTEYEIIGSKVKVHRFNEIKHL
ncbi:MAG TPA: histidine phosphatase family protein [Patescibacteria group bacterium]